MTQQEALNWFNGLNRDQKIKALALLAHELTVLARDTYEVGTRDVLEPQRLRTFNEAQHAVTNALIHVVEHSLDVDFLWIGLSEKLTHSEFEYACDRVAKFVND